VASLILQENAFPRRDYKRFLSDGGEYNISSEKYKINLDLGFGAPLPCDVNLVFTVQPGPSQVFFHNHIEYQWPPAQNDTTREERIDFVFPAVLPEGTEEMVLVEQKIENYLSILLDSPSNFQFFPVWNSELKVLRRIYLYYLSHVKDQPRPKAGKVTFLST
jgi:hypothetical protein